MHVHVYVQSSLCPVWNHEMLFPLSRPFLEPGPDQDQDQDQDPDPDPDQGQVSEVRVVLKDRNRGLLKAKPVAQVGREGTLP